MKTKRTKEMIIEFERVRVVCRRTIPIVNQCRECRTETDFVTVAEAARMIETNLPTIFRLIEAGVLHSLSGGGGEIYICLASLLTFEENRLC
ncbi:MAG: helix-turn-helix domain-containing protein [Pyrinomonadaceae bacterium]|nr:helix-turn-helix domain-containing protein [Pyrinomonadaceae bacterium]